MTRDQAARLGTQIGETVAIDIEHGMLQFLVSMHAHGATEAEIRDVLRWYAEQLQHWLDDELEGQVRAMVRPLLEAPAPADAAGPH